MKKDSIIKLPRKVYMTPGSLLRYHGNHPYILMTTLIDDYSYLFEVTSDGDYDYVTILDTKNNEEEVANFKLPTIRPDIDPTIVLGTRVSRSMTKNPVTNYVKSSEDAIKVVNDIDELKDLISTSYIIITNNKEVSNILGDIFYIEDSESGMDKWINKVSDMDVLSFDYVSKLQIERVRKHLLYNMMDSSSNLTNQLIHLVSELVSKDNTESSDKDGE